MKYFFAMVLAFISGVIITTLCHDNQDKERLLKAEMALSRAQALHKEISEMQDKQEISYQDYMEKIIKLRMQADETSIKAIQKIRELIEKQK